ncbi:unnamed protein product [Rhizophagus irregularis]|uniref:Uncharacterized protein n=1 Tax=Rhizophagus irregularis TaxID=588596 RepID=A0A2N1NZJ6_9GLOM|nr:hypothetical protein RhiirC2_727591 [Rhizophagus irregularis]CAB4389503.1 unnamed protein product [Rhizophagus irregularis]CAB5319777.1 unnamed protein product [Rhizophagus irregularis]
MSLLASRYLRRTFGLSRSTPIVRNFTASGPVKDIIQDLYVKGIKAYQPPSAAAGSEVGQVKKLSLSTSEPPKIDADVSSELTAYETEEIPPPEKILAAQSLEKQIFTEKENVHAH